MSTNRLSDGMAAALNAQMTKEAHAAQIYLAYAAWLDDKGYDGMANFLFRHAHEERNHMMKFLEYILQRGAKVRIEAIPAPGEEPKNVNDCFEKFFQQEVDNTQAIYMLVKKSFDEGDWATWHFLQWFVKEQVEEETLAMNLLDRIKIAGGEKASNDALYVLDRDLKDEPDEAELAQEATAENP
ncbi:MAG: ferritin [Bacteroidetes bacterium]|nr:ferritin [Bacteroidota bacterium]